MEQPGDLEQRIRSVGRRLHGALSGVPPVFDTRRWLGRLMAHAMGNEDFKVRLFRFIDVLPSLGTDVLVVRLLREYFGEAEAPKLIRRGVGVLGERGGLPRIAGPLVRRGVAALAGQFIAGNDPRTILASLDSLQRDGSLFSVDLLGEVVVSEREAKEHAERYGALVGLLAERFSGQPRPDVSIKVSSFNSQLDPVDWEGSIARTREALRPLLRRAKQLGISVTFDMEHHAVKDLIIAIFESVLDDNEFRDGPDLGIALQAYLRKGADDAAAVIRRARERKRRIAVRLVKGAYWDYEVVVNRRLGWPVPVFLDKEETDANFEGMTRLLLENSDIVRPAIATHNLRSLSHAVAAAEALGVAKGDFEFQMLYGMAEPLRKALREQGFPLRVYVPVGEPVPGMAYLVRRLLENTSNASFLRRSFGSRESFDDLIRPPVVRTPVPSAAEPPGGAFRNEPALDFSIAGNRAGMQDAIRSVRAGMGGAVPLLIGGTSARRDREFLSRNPARPGEAVARVSSASREDADAAVEGAVKAFGEWRKTGAEERAGVLFRAAAEMRKQRLELAAIEVIEVGKTWRDADADVAEAIDYLEYYGREMVRLGRSRALGGYPGEENEYRYGPIGVAVVIAPWNFPLAIPTGMTAAAVVAGNCAIFKPSERSSATGSRLCDLFRAAGLPAGVLQFLPGAGSEVGAHLVAHPDVDLIAFTGSKETGLAIMRTAAEVRPGQRSVKRVIAEMGGKNAIIVDETADLDEAVKEIIRSAFDYQGQKCSACSRVIAVGGTFGSLRDRLADAVSSIAIGPPEDPASVLGPVIDEAALRKVRSYVDLGRKEGRAVLERDVPAEGWYAGPVLFVDIPPASRVATEEIFGPVLLLLRAPDIDEAVRVANGSQYALTGGLFSRSPANIRRVKESFLVGNLYINRKITGALVGRQPFGGFRMSGVGSKAGGPDYLLQFLHARSISENTIRRGFAPFDSRR